MHVYVFGVSSIVNSYLKCIIQQRDDLFITLLKLCAFVLHTYIHTDNPLNYMHGDAMQICEYLIISIFLIGWATLKMGIETLLPIAA